MVRGKTTCALIMKFIYFREKETSAGRSELRSDYRETILLVSKMQCQVQQVSLVLAYRGIFFYIAHEVHDCLCFSKTAIDDFLLTNLTSSIC